MQEVKCIDVDQKLSDFTKKLFDSAVILAGFSILVYFIVFLYESAYLTFFNIPTSYIKISTDLVLNFFVMNRLPLYISISALYLLWVCHDISLTKKNLKILFIHPSFLLLLAIILSFVFGYYIMGNIFLIVNSIGVLKVFNRKTLEDEAMRRIAASGIIAFILMIDVSIIHDLNKNIKEVQIVNIQFKDYLVVRTYDNNMILKAYNENDTLKDLRDRKQFEIKEINKDCVFDTKQLKQSENGNNKE